MPEVSGPTFSSLVSGPTFTSDQAPGPTFTIDEVPGPMSLHRPSCPRSLDQPLHLTRPMGRPSRLTKCLGNVSAPTFMPEVSGPTFTSKVSGPTFTTDQAPGPTFTIDEVPGPMSLDRPSCMRSLDQPSQLTRPLGRPSRLMRSLGRCLCTDLHV